jgi:hypothetical protein
MKKVKFIFLGLSVMIALTNCKKDDHDDHDHNHDDVENKVMTVTINNPSEGQMFALNDDVNIGASITANFEIHGYEVKLFNESNNDSLMFENFVHQHSENVNVSEIWTNTVSSHSDVRIEVSALADHEGNERETAIVHIHCHPM